MRNGEMLYTCCYNTGVICERSHCDHACGWGDGERARRAAAIRRPGALKKDARGLWRFSLKEVRRGLDAEA